MAGNSRNGPTLLDRGARLISGVGAVTIRLADGLKMALKLTTIDIGEAEMRRSIRTLFVCLLVALVVYQPALACHSCGGWGGGHYAPAYYGYGYGPAVYSGGCSNCGGCD